MIGRTEVTGIVLGDVMADLHIRIWEPLESQRSVLCLHGFAGTGQDFEVLAETLVQSGITVIAPDLIGRGASSFLGDDKAYSLRAYIACVAAAARFQKPQACHLGTSWGGIILLAWLGAAGWPSRGVVLNDVPLQSSPAVQGFREALEAEAFRAFDSLEEAGDYVIASRSMGFLEGALRQRFIQSRVMQVGGVWRMRYDPAVAAAYGMAVQFSLLRTLAAMPVPGLLAYGAQSPYAADPDLPGIVAENPRLQVLAGLDDPHPPSLMKLSQVLPVAGFFGQCFGAVRTLV